MWLYQDQKVHIIDCGILETAVASQCFYVFGTHIYVYQEPVSWSSQLPSIFSIFLL